MTRNQRLGLVAAVVVIAVAAFVIAKPGDDEPEPADRASGTTTAETTQTTRPRRRPRPSSRRPPSPSRP